MNAMQETVPMFSSESAWIPVLLALAMLVIYELVLWQRQKRNPQRAARSAHARLREEWFLEVSKLKGSEILGVQTLRNSMMSATMTASTAMLGLMGAMTLAIPSFKATLADHTLGTALDVRLVLELGLIALLFSALICSSVSVRYYHHTGFVAGMPVGSEARRHWTPTAIVYLKRAGVMYSWALHHLMLVAPLLAALVTPWAGPIAAAVLIAALMVLDRFSEQASAAVGQHPIYY